MNPDQLGFSLAGQRQRSCYQTKPFTQHGLFNAFADSCEYDDVRE